MARSNLNLPYFLMQIVRESKEYHENFEENQTSSRFLVENVKKRHPYTRQKFAMYEIKAILANILYNFYVDLTANIKLQSDIVLSHYSSDSHKIHQKSCSIGRCAK
ncbi:hypothetical protein TSAR_011131 [Trichomalopsis sarcophagae]|uniref:Uncharacterized protein n=1 Tax=Trichomalopsis sarcophagae TaxID=543379 RepID=A0A232FG45_9HYME|nr:hypothetical protein TSAR_011131 [Trichomalopsis sarcophagae]